MDLLDMLFIVTAGLGVRRGRERGMSIAEWPAWGVVALSSMLWLFVVAPLLYMVAIANGHVRSVMLIGVGPAVVVFSCAVAVSILTATDRLERTSGNRLTAILLWLGGAFAALGAIGLVMYGLFAFLNLMFSTG